MRHRLFRLTAAAFFFAALYHLAAIAVPRFGAMAYPTTYPLCRHLLFIAINTSFGVVFLRRPTWLIWPYTLLVLQNFNEHGVAAWTLWQRESRIDWVSVVTVVGTTLGLVLVIAERKAVTSAVTASQQNARVE